VFTALARVLLKEMAKVKAAKLIKRLFLVSLILVLVAEFILYMRPLPSLQPIVNIKIQLPAAPFPYRGQHMDRRLLARIVLASWQLTARKSLRQSPASPKL
jgi:hypothetical protein